MEVMILSAPGKQLYLKKVPDPIPSTGQVRIRNMLIGVNYGDTILQRLPAIANLAFGVGALFGIKSMPGPHPITFPFVPGFEVAGIIDESSDPAFPQGSRVLAFPENGGYAEYTLAPTNRIVHIPDTISYESALSIGIQGITAYDLLYRVSHAKSGETLLIQSATGGVGHILVQLALNINTRVIGTASNPQKIEMLRKMGVFAVDSTQPDWTRSVDDTTEKKGVDVVLDAVGGKNFRNVLRVVRPGGRVVSYGAADMKGGLPKVDVMRDLKMQGLTLIAYKDNWLLNSTQDNWKNLVSLTENNVIKPVVGQKYAFHEANRAWDAISHRRTVGKTILVIHE